MVYGSIFVGTLFSRRFYVLVLNMRRVLRFIIYTVRQVLANSLFVTDDAIAKLCGMLRKAIASSVKFTLAVVRLVLSQLRARGLVASGFTQSMMLRSEAISISSVISRRSGSFRWMASHSRGTALPSYNTAEGSIQKRRQRSSLLIGAQI